MRRFGDPDSFLDLIGRIRRLAPQAGIRSNVIVGFPGETERDVELLTDFLAAAELDVVGVFGYSDEEGTEAAGLAGKLGTEEIVARQNRVSELVERLCEQRATDRIGDRVQVLIERVDDAAVLGRAAHQGPEVDGVTTLMTAPDAAVGDLVTARVTDSAGIDLIARCE